MQDVIKEVKAGRKLVISGFHDALKAAGVTEQQIELKKPEQMTASGSDAEARRVEVALQ